MSVGNATYCHQCRRLTPGTLIPLASGHIGNCCSLCRATRKGRPFASRNAFQTFTANAREGRGLSYVSQ